MFLVCFSSPIHSTSVFWLRNTRHFYTSVPLQVLGTAITACLLPAVLHHPTIEIPHGSRSTDPKVDLIEYMKAELTYGLSVLFDTPLWYLSSASNLLASISFCSWLSGACFGRELRCNHSNTTARSLHVSRLHFARLQLTFPRATSPIFSPCLDSTSLQSKADPILLYPASCIRLEGSLWLFSGARNPIPSPVQTGLCQALGQRGRTKNASEKWNSERVKKIPHVVFAQVFLTRFPYTEQDTTAVFPMV